MVNVDIDVIVRNNLKEFKTILAIMETKYTVPIITPGMSQDDIMYRSGQYSVLLNFREMIARAEANPNTIVL